MATVVRGVNMDEAARIIARLCFVGLFSVSEIARRLGWPEQKVESLMTTPAFAVERARLEKLGHTVH